MDDGAPNTKGLGFVNARTFLTARFGVAGWDAVLAAMTPADRTIVSTVVPVGWYRMDLWARLQRTIEKVHGAGDFSLAVQIGRYSAEHDLKAIHRMFLRMFSPMLAVEKIAQLWPRYQDSGHWTIDSSGPGHLVGHLEKWGGNVDPITCLDLAGYTARCLELAGAKDVVIEHARCGALGASSCDFGARWGDASARRGAPVVATGWVISPMPSGQLPVTWRGPPSSANARPAVAPATVRRRDGAPQ